MTLGSIGVSFNSGWSEASNPDNPEDVEASERAMQFDLGWFAHPIYKVYSLIIHVLFYVFLKTNQLNFGKDDVNFSSFWLMYISSPVVCTGRLSTCHEGTYR